MPDDVGRWLEELGLGEYAEAFAENKIDFRVLPELNSEDLREMDIPLGPRKLLLKAIAELQADGDATIGTAETAASEAASQGHPATDAERRQLTVMFVDLVGSTELSAKLDPEVLREVMRRYQDAVAGAVTRYAGHVAKYLGDGVLAYFGWPQAHEDQAERAVRAGLDAVAAVSGLKLDSGVELQARTGIATGQVVIGDLVGEMGRDADAVSGETPNLAARLQQVADPGQVVIGATTRLLIGEALDLEDIGTHRLKGFAEPVAAWRVVGESTAETRFEAAHPGALTKFVGREHELGLLKRAWQQSQAGVGQVVLVSGEAGIGKSRLVDALSAELGDKGYTRITIGCSPYHTNSALFPVIVHLERVLRWQREDGADVKLAKLEEALQDFSLPLEEAIPLFASLLSLPLPEDRYPPITVTPQQQKQQTLDATVAWLLEEAERQPVLQVWEDLHWADPSTLELLTLEIEQAPTAPILNVLTFRPEFQPPWPQRSHMRPLTLNRLERPEVEALITLQAGGKALPEEVVEHIVGKTDGVPLYVEELTKAILEADFLRERNGSYELAGQLSEVTIPATLQDSLMARLDRLPSIREVAQLGAVLGREFAYEMVQAIASIEETKLQEGLARLVDAELLYQRGRPPRAKYIFKHALIQDAAYESLLKSRRKLLHGRIATVLEGIGPDYIDAEPELLAHHCTEAGLMEKAAGYWLRAGERAIKRSANVEAIGHLENGLAVLNSLSETPERAREEIRLQSSLAVAFMTAKGYSAPQVEKAYARARVLCEQVGDMSELFRVARGEGQFHMRRGRLDRAKQLGGQCLKLAERQNDAAFRLEAHHLLWSTLVHTGDLAEAQTHTDYGIAHYDADVHHNHAYLYAGHDPGVCCRNYSAWLLWLHGFPARAAERTDEALALADRLSHPYSRGLAFYSAGVVHQMRGDVSAVREWAEALAPLSQEHGFPFLLARGRLLSGWVLTRTGQLSEGIAMMRDAMREYRAAHTAMDVPHYLAVIGQACGQAGDFATGLGVLEEAFSIAEQNGERLMLPDLFRIKAELLAMQGAASNDAAKKLLTRGLAEARRLGARSLELRTATSLARLLHDQGKSGEAHALLAPVHGWFTEGYDTADLKEAKALLDELA